MANLTALVHTKNSEATLEKCLSSLHFADKIFVIDMKSADNTRKIARRHRAELLEHEDIGFVEPARKFALEQVKTPWTLILDADEEVSETLAAEFNRIIEAKDGADAYYIPRQNIVFDKWIEHTGWWPDFQLRFFKTGKVEWPEHIHSQPTVHGSIQHFEIKKELSIIHHNYQTIEQFLDRMNRYTTIEVNNGQKRTSKNKKQITGNIPTAFSQEFSRRFFLEEGFLDGGHGLALAYLQSMYQVIVELKLWQKKGFPNDQSPEYLVEKVDQSIQELQYWIAGYSIQRSSGLSRLIWILRRKLRL